MFKNLICLCANQSAVINIHDFAEFTLLVKTKVKFRINFIFCVSSFDKLFFGLTSFFCFSKLFI